MLDTFGLMRIHFPVDWIFILDTYPSSFPGKFTEGIDLVVDRSIMKPVITGLHDTNNTVYVTYLVYTTNGKM